MYYTLHLFVNLLTVVTHFDHILSSVDTNQLINNKLMAAIHIQVPSLP